MKQTLLLISFLLASTAFAESELVCTQLNGSKVILKAKITQQVNLEEVTFDLTNSIFSSYFVEEGSVNRRFSFLKNPKGVLEAKEISGKNQYKFIFGKYTYKARSVNQMGEYKATLFLPKVLSGKVSAQLVYSPSKAQGLIGNNHLNMTCTAK